MLENYKFETFVDVHSDIFNEYLSSIITKLPEDNENYRSVQNKIESLYKQHPKILGIFDSETAVELTQEECETVIKIMELKNHLVEMEIESVYFRGCYDSIGYLKKAGAL